MAFRKPGTKRMGAKVLAYGLTGSGKSVFGLTWPKIAAIDAENGLTNYENSPRGKNLLLVDNTQSFKALETSLEYIEDNYKSEGIQTMIIDSETKIYNNIEQVVMTVEEKRAREKNRDVDDTNLSMRSYGRIRYVGTKLQNMKIDLTSNGVHVISVAQAKAVKKKVGNDFVISHYIPSMNKEAEFDYDIVLFFYREEDLINGGYKYFVKVEKDRTETFAPGKILEGGASYENWRDYYEGLEQSGKEVLGSSFSENIDSDINEYNNDVEEEVKSYKIRINETAKTLKGDDLSNFLSEIKALKIANPDSMTENQQKKLDTLLNRY